MKLKLFRSIPLICLLGCMTISGWAQDFRGQKLGLYISSKTFSYTSSLYQPINQFLTVVEDRSYAGKMKPEFIIRLGWLLADEIKAETGADTVFFLNAEMARGRAFQETYDLYNLEMISLAPALQDLSMIFVMDSVALSTRKHRSVFIRSNRMITEYIDVKKGSGFMHAVDPRSTEKAELVQFCFDNQTSPKPAPIFDLYKTRSPMGGFMSRFLSQWWVQWRLGEQAHCNP